MIPKRFNLAGQEIQVVWDNEYMLDREILGEVTLDYNVIKLATKGRGAKELPKERIEQVYFHEVVHAILDTMGKDKLSSSEEFVEGFSSLLYQVLKTSKYE